MSNKGKVRTSSANRCDVAGCRTVTTEGKLFFSLPGDYKRRNQWLRAIKRTDLLQTSTYIRICEDHFTADSIKRSVASVLLRRDAVPTLHLPVNEAASEVDSDSDRVENVANQDLKRKLNSSGTSDKVASESDANAIIARVHRYLSSEYEYIMLLNKNNTCDLRPLKNVLERTADATGVTVNNLNEILESEEKRKAALRQYAVLYHTEERERIIKRKKAISVYDLTEESDDEKLETLNTISDITATHSGQTCSNITESEESDIQNNSTIPYTHSLSEYKERMNEKGDSDSDHSASLTIDISESGSVTLTVKVENENVSLPVEINSDTNLPLKSESEISNETLEVNFSENFIQSECLPVKISDSQHSGATSVEVCDTKEENLSMKMDETNFAVQHLKTMLKED